MRQPRFFRLAMVLSASLCLALSARAQAEAMAHWTFDNFIDKKETLGDTVGPNAHQATPENTGALKPFDGEAPFGKAIEFSGSSGGHAAIQALNIQGRSFTIMTWFRLNSAGLNPFLSDWGKNEIAYFFGVNNNNRDKKLMLTVEFRSAELLPGKNNKPGSPAQILRVQKGEVSLNEWHHAAFVWDRTGAQEGTLTIYLDGDEVASHDVKVPLPGQQVPHSVNIRTNIPGKNVRIGGQADNNAVLKGALDEMWVFNEALSAEQVKNMMRTNNTRGEGAIAKVLIPKKEEPKSEEPKVAVAPTPKPAEPVTPAKPDTQVAIAPTPTPMPPAAEKSEPVSPTPAVTPKPAEPVTPKPAPTVAEKTSTPPATDKHSEPAVAATPPADTTPSAAPVRSVTNAIKTNAVIKPRYTPERLAGIITCFSVAASLGGFLIWAVGERAKLRAGHS